MKTKENKPIKIIIDENLLNTYYNDYYFIKYPKRKKKPITQPIFPSLNSWIIMPRMSMNNLKQSWKEFGEWVINYYNYNNLNIDNCIILFEHTFKTKKRRDPDNYIPKFFLDAMVSSKTIIDDSMDVIKKLNLICVHGNENKTKITILPYHFLKK